MGRHVDTTRPVDHVPWARTWPTPQHQKPGPAHTQAGTIDLGDFTQDVWSGDPDTDRAWAHGTTPNWDAYNRTGILR